MTLIIILIAIAVAVVAVAGFVVARSRNEGLTIERPETETLDRSSGSAPVIEAERPVDEVGDTETLDGAPAPLEEDTVVTFRDRLGKARSSFSGFLGSALSRSGINSETWDELEEALILADVGVGTSTEIIEAVREQAKALGTEDSQQLVGLIKSEIATRLGGFDRSLNSSVANGTPVWLFVGVNGVGKTTTIGKLANREARDGKKVLLAAGDTFRAAAAEQLTMWAERADVDIVRGAEGADPSSVVFDAVESATAKGSDLVMADTAGRLQTKTNLMEELSKVRRVAEKGAGVVTETLLVMDATTGQNGLSQARLFTEAVQVTGIVLTKLDGSAKGGIVVAIQSELGVPIKLVGLGEGINDLVPFDAEEFVNALFD